MKRTKIVCTIGPASETKTKIEKMVLAGLNVARLNFSHGAYKHHAMLITNIRAVAQKLGLPVAILQDLQGPRIRIGEVSKEGIKVAAGQIISLVPENYRLALKDMATFIPIQYSELYKDVKPGDPILIDDAKIELKVLEIKNKAIRCQVKIGDVISSHKGMNFPKSTITTPPITQKDKADLKFGLAQSVDFVALSFVKSAGDVIELRHLIYQIESRLGRRIKNFKKPKRSGNWPGTHTKIIAKIERPEAVAHFEEILAAADGIMVARGDLGLEVPLEDLPLIQKKIVRRCVQESKPVIVATQMLDSMIRYPVPTRAEVSDVANAILDGTDAIMLSGETATGKYPLKAVQVMAKIANTMEKQEIAEHKEIQELLKKLGGITETVSYAVPNIAEDVKAKLIVCATTSGFTARSIAKYRPQIKIVALAATEKTRNQLCLSWGVEPYHLPFAESLSQLILRIKKLLVSKKIVKRGDVVVIAAGHPFGYLGQTNLIKVETI
ncbi:MAG: pyruvate kinase [Candidatus Buchananbacteria bacterium RIFCSPLOWO2_01_FULL_46_12]|uniref:Pyruvate kinase n=2 Tax=Candidatus Buchananiibacteriota TaxID=1817903 RepID=A0A1G1YVR9_9BACT|nr:MAG: pyruvate kinase [Candidatus Buchananbacteria bacterium RIFCSPHIGHO2_01_FULL_44_11]OGY55856.1 MAG: pyruvate kinase [Candidatus Buchananbacteria bacterium RIFCSPLOWO2_01_FULL_46_12]